MPNSPSSLLLDWRLENLYKLTIAPHLASSVEEGLESLKSLPQQGVRELERTVVQFVPHHGL